ncbi:MAG TPA: helix-turn-helix transcriptional regulator [Chitinophaga sp.]|uniref:helix-turn-helix domain-containing protein n=1 Tax=Chitinophaga sp. TaxID=1869181 RepID=UPI002DBD1806|nr:helix-turn-helix transcriptional regulator [Chitinophaga sp.]HEU4552035.1 helix-turn-helix transcriptional regulator [Chitinophaga sp.]
MEGRKLRCTRQVAILIKHLRRRKEYSQEYMAAHLDISQNAYSKLETGKISISIDRLCDVARILDINPAELLGKIEIN